MREALFLEIVGKIVSADARVRDVGADEVTDLVGGLDSSEASALCVLLVAARMVEMDRAAQEAQLNALSELVDRHALPMDVVDRLRTIARPNGDPSQDDALESLLNSPHLRKQ